MGTPSVGGCFEQLQLIEWDQEGTSPKPDSDSFQGTKGDHFSDLAWLHKIWRTQHRHRIGGFEVGLTCDQTTAITNGDSHRTCAAPAFSSRMDRDVGVA